MTAPEEKVTRIPPPLTKWRGQVTKTLANATTILSRDPEWQGVLQCDAFAGDVRVAKKPPRHSLDGGGPDPEIGSFWSDRLTDRTIIWCEHHHEVAFEAGVMHRAIELAAEQNTHHPIKDYLAGLQWDGKSRLDTWLVDHVRAEGSEYVRAVGAMWMLSAVARIYEPGCQADYVLILEGAQRGGKSSVLRALCKDPEWFLETSIELGTKDAYQTIRAKWIVEMAELDSLSRGEAARAKAFITNKIDTYRPSYGRKAVNHPRSCVFAGTVNDSEYLKDHTGGARFWPVTTPASQRDRLDIRALTEARDQLWAEALVRYRAGEKWYPEDAAFISAAETEQEARRVKHPWEEPIWAYLGGKKRRAHGVTIREILKALDVGEADEARARQNAMRVAAILGQFGWRNTGKKRSAAEDPARPLIYMPKEER